MRRIVLLVLFAATLLCSAPVQAAPILFDSYEFGTPKAEIEKIPGVKQGEGDMSADLILPGISWSGHDWTAQFIFESDKLVTVTLLKSYTRQSLNDVRNTLTKDHFEILGIVVDNRALDLFQLIKAEGVEAFQKRFSEILREKTPERISYEYFQTKGVSDEQKKMTNSMNEFLRVVDMNILQAEVTMLGEATGSAPQALLVSFFCPVLNSSNQPKGKF